MSSFSGAKEGSSPVHSDNATDNDDDRRHFIEQSVLTAYYKSSGIPVADLDKNLSTSTFADSLARIRAREYLRKKFGIRLTIRDMTKHKTIAAQIEFLQLQSTHLDGSTRLDGSTQLEGSAPSATVEMYNIFGGPKQGVHMQEIISKTLRASGLQGSDCILSIFPVHDYLQLLLQTKLIDSWNFCVAVISRASSVKELRAALERALANHPVLTSFYVYDQAQHAYYVTLKPDVALWDLCILDYGSLKTLDDVRQVALQYPGSNISAKSGPLFQCLLVRVEETGYAAMVINVHHLAQDASSLRLFLEDVEKLLSDSSKDLSHHTDFKAWSESYVALRQSPAATVSVKYHVQRLSNLHLHSKGLYPSAAMPRRAATDNPDSVDFILETPGLIDLREAHPEILAFVLLKAAMAIVNVCRTGHTHALFNNFEAGRDCFPFIPDSLEAINPATFESSDVNGPIMQGVCNVIEVSGKERAIVFLRRLQNEQTQLTQHAHAPLLRVLGDLNALGKGAGDIMIDVHRAQFLTWLPGLLGEYESLRIAQIAIRPVAGLVIAAALTGPSASTYVISMRQDMANYSRELTAEFAKDLELALLWLTSVNKLERPIQGLLDAIKKV